MKKQTLLLLIITLYFSFNAYSQACGQGTLILSIYTINGNKVKDISYEIFPASKELIEKYTMDNAWESGKIIAGFTENDLLPNEDLTKKLNWYLAQSAIPKSGKMTTTLKFKTFETGYFPIILKIRIKDKTVYIFGNYFGGCNRQASLIWNGSYFKLM